MRLIDETPLLIKFFITNIYEAEALCGAGGAVARLSVASIRFSKHQQQPLLWQLQQEP
jgi:hypothetical protein